MAECHIITGVAGFIGRSLTKRLLQLGATVAGFDNFRRGTPANIAEFQSSPAFSLEVVDLSEVDAYRKALRHALQRFGDSATQAITVWHMAANSDILAGSNDPSVDLRDTYLTTFNTLQLMRENRLTALAFASSSAVYGPLAGPLTETSGPLFPISNYGAMKLASEASISAAVESFLTHAWIYRFPNVVGTFATHGLIFDLINKLKRNPHELEVLGDGNQRKAYLLVDELIDAMFWVRSKALEPLNFYNLGPPDDGITVREIAEEVVRVTAPGARIRFTGGAKGWVGDVPQFSYSVAKISHLGWQPQHTSRDAIRTAVRAIWEQCA